MTLLGFIALYLIASIGIGVYAATRVRNTADYALAGRSLPLFVIVATTFATWFGSETVLGIPSKFVEGGFRNTVEDPFGAGLCLVLVGMFFARKLYKMDLLTIGDFYRRRYGRGVEIFSSIVILISYLGWVAAQITALGLVFNLLSAGGISIAWGMVLGTAIVLVYTLFGGMWSVALTDTFQMVIIIVGPVADRDLRGRAGGRCRPCDRVRAIARDVPVLSGRRGARVAVLDRRCDHDHDRLDPAAGRVSARDVGEGCRHVGQRTDHRRHLVHGVRDGADFYRAVGVSRDAGARPIPC